VLIPRASDDEGGAVVERVRERGGRFDQVEPEVEAPEERRRCRGRVDGGADVVAEAGKRQLGGACPAADGVARLENEDRTSRPRESDRGGKPVRPGADDDCV
jgi:hypothetical protein